MTTELWIAVLTFLTGATGCVRWLIHVYWSQAREIESLRKTNQSQFVISMDRSIADHKRILDAHQRELIHVSDQLLKIQGALAKNTEANSVNTKLLNDYIETAAARFQKLESEFIQLRDGLVLVKGKPSGGGGQRN